MKIFEVTVYGSSVPQGRARIGAVYGRNGPVIKNGRVIVTAHTPKETRAWRKLFQAEAQRVIRETDFIMFPDDVALVMSIVAAYQRPKSVSLKKRPHHTVKPDLDNVAKNIKDALSGVVYHDDKQVIKYVEPFEKRYCRPDEQPFAWVRIMTYTDWLEEEQQKNGTTIEEVG